MSWKAMDYDDRKNIGVYPDEMSMAQDLREKYSPGAHFIVENDDGREFEAFLDDVTVKIVTSPSLAFVENEDMYADPEYRPSDGKSSW